VVVIVSEFFEEEFNWLSPKNLKNISQIISKKMAVISCKVDNDERRKISGPNLLKRKTS